MINNKISAGNAFGKKMRSLDFPAAIVATGEATETIYQSMPREFCLAVMRHAANDTGGIWVASQGRQITVGRDAAFWNLGDEGFNLASKICRISLGQVG